MRTSVALWSILLAFLYGQYAEMKLSKLRGHTVGNVMWVPMVGLPTVLLLILAIVATVFYPLF